MNEVAQVLFMILKYEQIILNPLNSPCGVIPKHISENDKYKMIDMIALLQLVFNWYMYLKKKNIPTTSLHQITHIQAYIHIYILWSFTILTFLCLQVYSGLWKERPVVIKCGIEDPVKTDGAPDSVLRQEMSLFDKPTRGTSMDEFKEMLHSFLKVVFLSNYTI